MKRMTEAEARDYYKPGRKGIGASILTVIIAVILYYVFAPMGDAPAMEAGWAAFRDDSLARDYAPLIASPERFGKIQAVYYRAARAADGTVRIAYHPVWAKESNPAPGFGPFMSRILYTGGLSFQRIMFGRGDVEAIAIEIAPDGFPRKALFERAKDYSESDFSVTHEAASEALSGYARGGPRPAFDTVSWNHLFVLRGPSSAGPGYEPQYFEPSLWQNYGMTKNPPTRLFRHRAHYPWEMDVAP